MSTLLRKLTDVLLLHIQDCVVPLGCSLVNMHYNLLRAQCTSSLCLASASNDPFVAWYKSRITAALVALLGLPDLQCAHKWCMYHRLTRMFLPVVCQIA